MRIKSTFLAVVITFFSALILQAQDVEITGTLKIVDGTEGELRSFVSDGTDGSGKWEPSDYQFIRYFASLNDGVTQLISLGEDPMKIWKAGIPASEILGNYYGGGLLIFLDTLDVFPDFDYISALTGDLSTGVVWGCNGTAIPGASNYGMGVGLENTEAIVANCAEASYAAQICADADVSGFDDWFLPSRAELELIMTVLYQNNLGNVNGIYWSSSQNTGQFNVSSAQYCWVNNNFCSGGMKTNTYKVRPVRRF